MLRLVAGDERLVHVPAGVAQPLRQVCARQTIPVTTRGVQEPPDAVTGQQSRQFAANILRRLQRRSGAVRGLVAGELLPDARPRRGLGVDETQWSLQY